MRGVLPAAIAGHAVLLLGPSSLCMAFAQFTYRESLRDIEACLRSSPDKLYHMGIRGRVSRSTLADANESHGWRIFADFAQILIARARLLYAHDSFGAELQLSAYALDSTPSICVWRCFPGLASASARAR